MGKEYQEEHAIYIFILPLCQSDPPTAEHPKRHPRRQRPRNQTDPGNPPVNPDIHRGATITA